MESRLVSAQWVFKLEVFYVIYCWWCFLGGIVGSYFGHAVPNCSSVREAYDNRFVSFNDPFLLSILKVITCAFDYATNYFIVCYTGSDEIGWDGII